MVFTVFKGLKTCLGCGLAQYLNRYFTGAGAYFLRIFVVFAVANDGEARCGKLVLDAIESPRMPTEFSCFGLSLMAFSGIPEIPW